MMLIMPCIYVVSLKSSKNPEFFFMKQFGQCKRWESGGQGKGKVIGKPEPRRSNDWAKVTEQWR